MPDTIPIIFVSALLAYAALGLLFAIPFVAFGVGRADPGAAHAGVGFRLLILPGVAVFWPLLYYRWAQGISEPPEKEGLR